jgi:hypothetical protein
MELLEQGDTESVNKLYLRLERYMKILCGQEFLSFDDCENVFEQLDDSQAQEVKQEGLEEPNIEESLEEKQSQVEIPDAFPEAGYRDDIDDAV